MAKLIKKIGSIGELHTLAEKDEQYKKLAFTAASNLGGAPYTQASLDGAIRWLTDNANETTEKDVVKEINACRDLL